MSNYDFQVEVVDDEVFTREVKAKISLTSNGHQWMTFGNLSRDELLKIKKEINLYLKSKNAKVDSESE